MSEAGRSKSAALRGDAPVHGRARGVKVPPARVPRGWLCRELGAHLGAGGFKSGCQSLGVGQGLLGAHLGKAV